nr:PREDICTED: uncharacterized protein LOC105663206 isoform X3 [Megachile rotundata]
MSLAGLPDGSFTSAEIIEVLLTEFNRRKTRNAKEDVDHKEALHSRGVKQVPFKNTSFNRPKTAFYKHCEKQGHEIKNCWLKNEEEIELQSSSSSGTEHIEHHAADISFALEFLDELDPSNAKKRKGRIQVIIENPVAVLDNCKISDREAVRVIITTAEALNHDLDKLIINRSSIQRCRRYLRTERTIKLAFHVTRQSIFDVWIVN